MPWAELDRTPWRGVGELAHELRAAGEAVPLTDLATAVAAVSTGASVWTNDADFERISSPLPELELAQP